MDSRNNDEFRSNDRKISHENRCPTLVFIRRTVCHSSRRSTRNRSTIPEEEKFTGRLFILAAIDSTNEVVQEAFAESKTNWARRESVPRRLPRKVVVDLRQNG